MSLLDVFSRGTKGLPVSGDPKRSFYPIPANEDWSMIVTVSAVVSDEETGETVISGVKIWDEEQTKTFYAILKAFGSQSIPKPQSVEIGSQIVFYRVAEGNGSGGTSFICFAHREIILIEDLGEGLGREVYYNENQVLTVPTSSETLVLKAHDIGYHEDDSPFKIGRVYCGYKIYATTNYYVVFIPAPGDEAKQFTAEIEGYYTRLYVDGAGSVLNFDNPI